jgi:hypothetical protein
MATVTLSKPSSKYSTDVRYCLHVEKNARSALIGLHCRDVGQIGSTVGSVLNAMQQAYGETLHGYNLYQWAHIHYTIFVAVSYGLYYVFILSVTILI